jgi:flagellar motor switch protein FliM
VSLGIPGLLRDKKEARVASDKTKALEVIAERFERHGCGEFVGILRSAQDDGKN